MDHETYLNILRDFVMKRLVTVILFVSSASCSGAPPKGDIISPVTRSNPIENARVCFSPDEDCEHELVNFVATANKSIDVAIYDINLKSLVDLLIAKSKTVSVRVLTDRRQSKGSHSLVSDLQQSDVKVRFGHQRGIMHNKFVILDGVRLETGSFNYTNHATQANNENQLYLFQKNIVSQYASQFERLWKDSLQ